MIKESKFKFGTLIKYDEYRSKINANNIFFYCCNYSDVNITSCRSVLNIMSEDQKIIITLCSLIIVMIIGVLSEA